MPVTWIRHGDVKSGGRRDGRSGEIKFDFLLNNKFIGAFEEALEGYRFFLSFIL